MELLEASVRTLVEALTERADLRDSADALARDILEVARGAGPEAQRKAVEQLAGAIPQVEVPDRARILLVLGALVERGAPPGQAADRVLDELEVTLQGARRFASWCEDEAETLGSDAITPAIEQQIAQRHPVEASRWKLVDPMMRAATSLLGRDPELREHARARPQLEANLELLRQVHPMAEALAGLLIPSDEERPLVH